MIERFTTASTVTDEVLRYSFIKEKRSLIYAEILHLLRNMCPYDAKVNVLQKYRR